ncbi:MAG: hypothetical protein PHR35_06720 [Kiritimatiellae bacterium]|nr:hypothetical protein [Kiritimatiellia bacterium]
MKLAKYWTACAALLVVGQMGPVRAGVVTNGLIQDLDANAGVVSDANGVSAWSNQVAGAGDHVAQTDNARKPRLLSAVANGRNALRFDKDGADDGTIGDMLAGVSETAFDPLMRGSGYTWFVVARSDLPSSGLPGSIFGTLLNGSPWPGLAAQLSGSGIVQNPFRSSIQYMAVGVYSVVDGNYHVLVGRVTDGSAPVITVYDNSSTVMGCVTGVTTDTTESGPLCVGAWRTGDFPNNKWYGDLARVLIYNRPLSDAEIVETGYALGAAYGISTGFSSTEPIIDFNADAGVVSDANGVSAWSNQIADAMEDAVVQTENNKKPVLLSAAVNGHSALRFDSGDSDGLAGDALAGDSETALDPLMRGIGYTWFVVARSDGPSGESGAIFGSLLNGAPWSGLSALIAYPGGAVRHPFRTADEYKASGTYSVADGSYHVLAGRASAGLAPVITVYDNSPSALGCVTGTTTGIAESGPLCIGAWRTGLFNTLWHGDLARILIYNRPLPDEELTTIGRSLAVTYGLSTAFVTNTTPILDLNADYGVVSDANGVSAWSNQVAGGAEDAVVQTNNAGKPTVLTGVLNGHNALRFDNDGADGDYGDRLLGDDLAAFDCLLRGGGYTWFVVARSDTPQSWAPGIIFGTLENASPYSGIAAAVKNVSGCIENLFRTSGYEYTASGSVSVVNGKYHVFAGRATPGTNVTITVYDNGPTAAGSASLASLGDNGGAICIGDFRTGKVEARWYGDLARVQIFNRYLTEREFSAAGRALANEYGIWTTFAGPRGTIVTVR